VKALLSLLAAMALERPSVIVVVLDDIGADQISAHPSAAADPPPTPTIGALAAEGLSFTNAWGAPRCSPARACLLTGRFPFRTGIGALVQPGTTHGLQAAEITLAERLRARGYRTALFGKWHLGLDPEGPCDQGFEVFVGTQGNLDHSRDYWDWDRIDDTAGGRATVSTSSEYSTTTLTDAALAWIASESRPYFAVLAYHAAHEPVHCPPPALQHECTETTGDIEDFRGMVESVDSEIRRIVAGIDRTNTTLIVVGDNGTRDEWTGVSGKSKGSVYRRGIEIPMILWGAAVDRADQRGTQDPGHAHIADLYSTVLALLPGDGDGGMQVLPLDSVSLYGEGRFASNRAWNFTERFQPLGAPAAGPYVALHRAVEDSAGFKLICRESGERELYATAADPEEERDLLADGIDSAEQAILDGLDVVLKDLGL
jgi:arylsulfatase A-like enzyme